MNKEEFVTYVNKIEAQHKKQNELLNQLTDLFGNFDGTLSEALFHSNELARDLIKKVVGDTEDWLDWYIFETEFSKVPLRVLAGDREFLIDSPESLFDLIKETHNV